MAKFSEVLGGIAKDVVQLQVSSDLASTEAVSHYQGQEILKFFDVPRFRISDIKLNLKFAISESEEVDHSEQAIKYVENDWLDTLKKEVFANTVKSMSRTTIIDQKRIAAEFARATSAITRPDLNFRTALEGAKSETVDKSVAYLLSAYDRLPSEYKKKIGTGKEFRKIVKQTVSNTLEEKLPALRKVVTAKSAVERDMEIIIEKDALEQIPDTKIHEISFNLTPDFVTITQAEEET